MKWMGWLGALLLLACARATSPSEPPSFQGLEAQPECPRCIICNAISRMIRTPIDKEFNERIEITEAEDPASWNCKVHVPVFVGANPHDTGFSFFGSVSLSKNPGSPVFRVDNSAMHLVRRDDIPNHIGMGRLISDPAWIDLDIIKGFLDNCKRRHGDLCENFPFRQELATEELPRPSFLIDLHENRIVSGSQVPADKPFVALSYVRSADDARLYLSLTKTNLDALQQPGALEEAALEPLNPPRTIPATFRDAMRLVALMGIQYLWIDRLCVPQDDGPAREAENSKSAYIAAGAAFVLAECDGSDASHGIRGVPGAQKRSFAQRSYPFGVDEAFIRMTGGQRDHEIQRIESTRVYSLRARSRVETATARRVLRFEMGTVQWECRSCPSWATGGRAVELGRMQADEHLWETCAHECSKERWGCPMDKPGLQRNIGLNRAREDGDQDDEEDEKSPDLSEQPWTAALGQPWPPIREYYAMLLELSQLKTRGPEEDLLDAASGLVTAFGRQFPGRMISGLPESCFDLAMLWRISAQLSSRNEKRPSWSWAGWKHQQPWSLLHAPEVDGADHIVKKDYGSVEIIPLVRWSVGDSPGLPAPDRLQLDSMRWNEARESLRESPTEPPPGWVRLEQSNLDSMARLGAPRGYDASSTLVLEDQKTKHPSFWYPIPMRKDHEPEHAPIDRRYLFAALEISRDGFYVHRADWPGQTDDQFVTNMRLGRSLLPGTHVLRDVGGKIAGVLDVHDPDHENIFHGPGSGVRTSVELVAISRGQTRRVPAPYPEVYARPDYRDFASKYWVEGWYEFYNVIWVKWRVENGTRVAERRGIGRVSRDVWETAQKDMEDVVLG